MSGEPRYDGGHSTVGISSSDPDTEPFELAASYEPGEHIGRFTVLGQLGRGGMGCVLSAYDPELERKIAIKVLRADVFDSEVAQLAKLRLVREARAMAKLAHPNVVTVYEADEIGDEVYIVMEQVAGGTLRDWASDQERTEREIVEAFVQAGRGLAAAHDAGLIHRDFKLENVLVDTKTGRFLVTDFGIAGAPAEGVDEDLSLDGDTLRSPPPLALTQTGDILGTPSYMAPEQHRGETTDARSDQFSFCVALYEVVYGQRPFAGRSYEELRANISSGVRAAPSRKVRVSSWIRAVLDRGLQLDPRDRYGSMHDLLAELGRDRTRARARWLSLAAIALLVCTVIGAWMLRHRDAAPCTTGAQHLDGVWDQEREKRLAALFSATGLPHADAVFAHVAERIDTWTAAWVEMRDDSCAATSIRKEQSPELLDRRTLCLDRALDGLRAMTDEWLRGTDEKVVDGATGSVASLPPVGRCGDAASLMAEVPYPDDPREREAIIEVERGLAEVAALSATGKPAAAYELVKRLSERAEATDYAPLLAKTRHQLANSTLLNGGSADSAERLFYSALEAASAARSDYEAALIWCDLMGSIAYKLDRPHEALGMRRAAELAIKRAGDKAELRRHLLVNLVMALNDAGKDTEAIAVGREALELLDAEQPQDPDTLARVYGWIAYSLMREGEYERSRQYLERSVGYVTGLSPNHPRLVFPLSILGQLEYYAGHPERSVGHLERALAVAEAAWGPTNLETGNVLTSLGIVYGVGGRYDDARRVLRRAMAIAEQAEGKTHTAYVLALRNLADCEGAAGDHEAALGLYAEAVSIIEQRGDGIEGTGEIELLMATVAFEAGKLDAALQRAESAMSGVVQYLGADHELYAGFSSLRGQIYAATARIPEARVDYQRARDIYMSASDVDAEQIAAIDELIAALP